MSVRDFAEKLRTGTTDGAVVVARALVQSCLADRSRVAEIAETARYAQLLAGRMRLPVSEVHRIVLAAWLTGLSGSKEMYETWIEQHGLEDILVAAAPDAADAPASGRDVLGLVFTYLRMKKAGMGDGGLDGLRTAIRKEWVTSSHRQGMFQKFMLVLQDEMFLQTLGTPGARILIVDPSEVISSVMSLPLRNKGYEVEVVGNADDARAALGRQIPDVIVAEQQMPIEDGVGFCRSVKADPKTSGIPLIMLSASKSQRIVRECLKAGAEDVLGKPVDVELVFMKLRKILGALCAETRSGQA